MNINALYLKKLYMNLILRLNTKKSCPIFFGQPFYADFFNKSTFKKSNVCQFATASFGCSCKKLNKILINNYHQHL